MRVPRGVDFEISIVCKSRKMPLNITGAFIVFTVKESKDGNIIFQKKNDVAGGSDSEILIVSGSDGLLLIKLDRSDTLSVTNSNCFCDLYVNLGSSDHVPLYEKFIIAKTALQGSEDILGGSEVPNKTLRFFVLNNSTITLKSSRGWTTIPTASFVGGNIQIASSDSEFINGKTKVVITNDNISYDANGSGSSTEGLIIIKPESGDYPFTINVNIYL